MPQWDYDFAIFPPGERLLQLKRMGRDGWELVAVVGDDDNKFWFKRPMANSTRSVVEFADNEADSQPSPPPPPPVETLSITLLKRDEDKVLAAMSNAGYYIKDISTDRVTLNPTEIDIKFTKREKK
jgi:hypothetical protein